MADGTTDSPQLRPNELPATIYGNNEMTCGNSYSTFWHVTARAEPRLMLSLGMMFPLEKFKPSSLLLSPSPTERVAPPRSSGELRLTSFVFSASSRRCFCRSSLSSSPNVLAGQLFVDAARAGRREAVEHRHLGVVEVWQPERFATIIRLDSVFAHGDGLPCRSLWDYGSRRYDASTDAQAATESTASAQEQIMAINNEKVDEVTLSLLT